MFWIEGQEGRQDYYAVFRGTFQLEEQAALNLETSGAGWFVVYLDGQWAAEGPPRFQKDHPEYDTTPISLAPGLHVLAVHAHHPGVTTRIQVDMPPFLHCRLTDSEGGEIPVAWKGALLDGHRPGTRRINAQLAWAEWRDTRHDPHGWTGPEFDDSDWPEPLPAGPGIDALAPSRIAPVRQFSHRLVHAAAGELTENFGYELDNPPVRFFLRDLAPSGLPAQGVWRRYDLGRVRLGRPEFTLDVPEGAVVEFAYGETLPHGRVSPHITLSASDSCNLDHFVARGGAQTFGPISPRGGRYIEAHILADPDRVAFLGEHYLERGYFDEPEGAFHCDDDALNRVWQVGIDTFRACAEDAVVDCPTRERGQWTGDVVAVGLDICAAGWSDLRLLRRALAQSALCAREDGLVSGMSPGGDVFVTTYALQWFPACLQYYRMTGDRSLLEETLPYAQANYQAFEEHATEEGLPDGLAWTFIDWGYKRNEGPLDIALNLHYYGGLSAFAEWRRLLGDEPEAAAIQARAARVADTLQAWYDETFSQEDPWALIGYHGAALGLRYGFFQGQREDAAIEAMKRHILTCFPNAPDAPRLSDPGVQSRRIITPYFAHYAFPPIIERGGMDFALEQYRACWSDYLLAEGRTTWLEVFDPRWSHCHQWSGSPTWQLTRYGLGLWPRYDLGRRTFAFRMRPGGLGRAEGRVPSPGSGAPLDVNWDRLNDGILYRVRSDDPFRILGLPGVPDEETVEVEAKLDLDRLV